MVSGLVQSALALVLQFAVLPRTLATLRGAGYEPPVFTSLWLSAWWLPLLTAVALAGVGLALARLAPHDPRALRLTAAEWALSLFAALLLAAGIVAMALPLMLPLVPMV